ncbi:hypothetical protein N431DRAFT_155051 [Stipitochalara longipes BDJ]|nr:hypothetical protein N431DRAFT_155051 [Stipitochalara longipes BDJ]
MLGLCVLLWGLHESLAKWSSEWRHGGKHDSGEPVRRIRCLNAWSFIFQPKSSSLALDPHMINIIDSDQLLQAIPIPRFGQNFMHRRAVSQAFLGSRTSPARCHTGKRVTRMASGGFRSVLISSHLERYGKQNGELNRPQAQSELCTDC